MINPYPVVRFLLGFLPRGLRFKSRRFGTLYRFHLHRHLPMKMEPIESSETSAFKTQTQGKNPQKKTYYIKNTAKA